MEFFFSLQHWLREFKRSPETPFKLFYLTFFGAMGAVLPYLSLHFHAMGLTGAQIGLLFSLIMAANMGMAPVWTTLTDFWGRRREIFVFNLAATALSFSLLLSAHSFISVALVVLVFSSFRSALIPMADAMVLENLVGRREEYGRIRIWGSAGYILLVLLVGRLIDGVGTQAVIYAAVVAYVLCSLFSARGLQPALPKWGVAKRSDLLGLFKNRRFVVFMICSFLVSLSGGPYIVFFSISVRQMGLSQSVVGISWMAAVLAEMAVMLSSPRIIRRFPLGWLLILSYVTWALRWYLMSTVGSPLPIVMVHLLHGITFGLYHPVAMNFLTKEVPSSLRNTGQGLFGALSYGMGGIVGNLLSGKFFDTVGLVTLYKIAAFVAIAAAVLFAAAMLPQRRPAI